MWWLSRHETDGATRDHCRSKQLRAALLDAPGAESAAGTAATHWWTVLSLVQATVSKDSASATMERSRRMVIVGGESAA